MRQPGGGGPVSVIASLLLRAARLGACNFRPPKAPRPPDPSCPGPGPGPGAATATAAVSRPRRRAQKALMRRPPEGVEHSAGPSWKSEGPVTGCRQGLAHQVLQVFPGCFNSVNAFFRGRFWGTGLDPGRGRPPGTLSDGKLGSALVTLHPGTTPTHTNWHCKAWRLAHCL